MLNYLSIKNYALIEDAFIEFTSGLNVLTGETGAGKSIIIDALGLSLGDRAASNLIRKGGNRLSVVASFRIKSKRLLQLLNEMDLSGVLCEDGKGGENELILRRDIDSSGRSRCFANDTPINLNTMARIGELLVDIHGQHEHQLLLKPSEQRELLDGFGGLWSLREKVATLYNDWRKLFSEQEALSLSEQERAQRIDLYRFQLQELNSANVRREEEEELERLLPCLKNAERLKASSERAYGLLYGDEGSALDRLRQVQRDFDGICNLGGELGDASEMLKDAIVHLEETAHELDTFRDGIEADPERLEEVLGRLDLLNRLKRKYGTTIDHVLSYRDKIREEMRCLESVEERTQDISSRLSSAKEKLNLVSKKLSENRQTVARKLSTTVEKELKELGLDRARFKVVVSQEKNDVGAFRFSVYGVDKVEFLIAPNPGEDLKPLAQVASGGELSRIMLALKTVLAESDQVPTLIFDEVDAGVGGPMGVVVGKKLVCLGRAHQVLCVTHLPQIASGATTHFWVEKFVKGNRTHIKVISLDEKTRLKEISRLLGGETDISVRHARELLASAKQ